MGAKPEDVGDDTYQGVWIMPTPERTRAHVFATPDEVAELFAQGAERASQR